MKFLQLCGCRQIAEPRKYYLVHVIVLLLAFCFLYFFVSHRFEISVKHVQVYNNIRKLIILYLIDLKIIFGISLLQPGPPKHEFLATPLYVFVYTVLPCPFQFSTICFKDHLRTYTYFISLFHDHPISQNKFLIMQSL